MNEIILNPKRFIFSLKYFHTNALLHLPNKSSYINKTFRLALITFFMLRKKKFRHKLLNITFDKSDKWILFLNRLEVNDISIINSNHMSLLKFILKELLDRSKRIYKHFWNEKYKELFLKLPQISTLITKEPNKIVNNDTYLVKSEILSDTMFDISLYNLKQPKLNFPITFKTVQINIYPTVEQNIILETFSNGYVNTYNKTIDFVLKELKKNKDYQPNEYELRNLLVTNNTKTTHPDYILQSDKISDLQKKIKGTNSEIEIDALKNLLNKEKDSLKILKKTIKSIKNPNIESDELKTPKNVRQLAVKAVVSAYKSAKTNFEKDHIKHFTLKKKTDIVTFQLDKSMIWFEDNKLHMSEFFFPMDNIIKVSKRNTQKYGTIEILHNVTFSFRNGWILGIPVSIKPKEKRKGNNFIGIDLGVKTFATGYGIKNDKGIVLEVSSCRNKILKLNTKLDSMKKNKVKKKYLNKIEKKKRNIINELH